MKHPIPNGIGCFTIRFKMFRGSGARAAFLSDGSADGKLDIFRLSTVRIPVGPAIGQYPCKNHTCALLQDPTVLGREPHFMPRAVLTSAGNRLARLCRQAFHLSRGCAKPQLSEARDVFYSSPCFFFL